MTCGDGWAVGAGRSTGAGACGERAAQAGSNNGNRQAAMVLTYGDCFIIYPLLICQGGNYPAMMVFLPAVMAVADKANNLPAGKVL